MGACGGSVKSRANNTYTLTRSGPVAGPASNGMKIKPLRDQVLLEPLRQETKKGGIILPETAQKERPEQAKVVAVGPGKLVDGKLVPVAVKRGDVVLFTKYGPNEIKVGEKEYLCARSKVRNDP